MVGIQREGGRHKRKSIRDDRALEEMPGNVCGRIAQRTLEDCWSLVSGVKPVARHVPVQAGKVPAVGLRKPFGQGEQALQEKLAVPAAGLDAVSQVSAPLRELLLEELAVQRRFDGRKLEVERGAPKW